MNWWNRLLGRERKPKSVLDEVQRVGRILICGGYRELAARGRCAPSAATSDDRIMEIYVKVVRAFHQAAETRGEHVSALYLNHIVFLFLQTEEMMGPWMVEEHLKYEIDKYLREGLREDYKRELKLFPD